MIPVSFSTKLSSIYLFLCWLWALAWPYPAVFPGLGAPNSYIKFHFFCMQTQVFVGTFVSLWILFETGKLFPGDFSLRYFFPIASGLKNMSVNFFLLSDTSSSCWRNLSSGFLSHWLFPSLSVIPCSVTSSDLGLGQLAPLWSSTFSFILIPDWLWLYDCKSTDSY